MPNPSDLEWLGLHAHDTNHWSFELGPSFTRHDGKLFGGTGIAVAVATMEAATARDALWTTVQYAGSADIGERIDCHVDVLAHGKRTSQVRVTATVGERVVIAAVGATGEARTGPIEAQIPTMPTVAAPDASTGWSFGPHRPGAETPPSWFDQIEMRHAGEANALWTRMQSGVHTRASIAFLSDMVPSSVARAAGRTGGGTSLDNSFRFGPLVDTDWILLDMDPWFGSSGYLHGAARVWAEDGTLLGVASQTSTAIVWDPDRPPWLDKER